MSSDLTIDSEYDFYSDFRLAPPLNYNDWNGRQINSRNDPEVCSQIEQRIIDIYNSGNHVLGLQLATLYFEQTHPSYEIQLVKSSKSNPHTFNPQRLKEFYDRMILEQNQILFEAGLIKNQPPPLEPISPTNFPALWAWKTYCLENGISEVKTHSGGLKKFWKEHKKAIIIAIVVIVVVATIIVIVTTVGAGTGVAVGTGAAALQSALDDYNASEDTDPCVQNFQYDPHINERIENFANAIGSTDVKDANGPITIIDASSSSIPSEITPEILTDLVTNWNENLTTSALGQSDPQFPSPLPWVNEGISYFQWKERNYREQLLNEWVNKSDTPANDSMTSAQSTLEEIPPKVASPREWVESSQEPYTQFNNRIVEDFLKDTESVPNNGSKNNYASQAAHFFDEFQSPPPFQAIPLIGNQGQSTINYHCGIGNSVEEIIEGGTCLYETLGEEFAVQPHLLHSPSVVKGLSFVALEQSNSRYNEAEEILQRSPEVPNFSELILGGSNIQNAINYQVENLSKIAQNIIEQNNPNLKQVHVTFSNGGYIFNEALKQLPPEYRETIIVVTTGSTAIIDRDLAHKVYNIIGDKDKGSQICNGGLNEIEKNKETADVKVIPQTETKKWIGGHYFMQSDYQEKISEYLNDKVLNKYEIY